MSLRQLLDLLGTRWRVWRLRRRGYEVGPRVSIGRGVHIASGQVRVGADVVIGAGVRLVADDEVVIGNACWLGESIAASDLRSLVVGEYSTLHAGIEIVGSASAEPTLRIGENCWIGERVLFNLQAPITVGNNVCIARESQIWTHGYFGAEVDGHPVRIGPVTIEDDAWLATRVMVLPDVTIAAGALVAPAAVVTTSIADDGLYAGVPARQVRAAAADRRPYEDGEIREAILARLTDALPAWGCTVRATDHGLEISGLGVNGPVSFLPEGQVLDVHAGPAVVFRFGAEDPAPVFEAAPPGVSIFDVQTRTYHPAGTQLERVVKRVLNERTIRFVRAT